MPPNAGCGSSGPVASELQNSKMSWLKNGISAPAWALLKSIALCRVPPATGTLTRVAKYAATSLRKSKQRIRNSPSAEAKVKPWATPSAEAASATVRPCGPTVSCVREIGTTPARLVRPTVGLMPTTPLAFAGQTMLPSVSEPKETAAKLAEAAAPEPELEPQGLRLMP